MKTTYDLIKERRAIRKFTQEKLNKKDLLDCINAARLAPSSANLQPLEFILIIKNVKKVFKHLKWAGYLVGGSPASEEEPTAYIIVISNKEINDCSAYDVGLATENIVLTALEKGIASCILTSGDKEKLIPLLNIPDKYKFELTIALGYPKQESISEKYVGDVKYWLDEKGIMHIPKKSIKNIFHEEKFQNINYQI